jgi:hypothetical protein
MLLPWLISIYRPRKDAASDKNYPPINDFDAIWDIKGQVMYVSYPKSTNKSQ